jgi:hypothetical protein
MLAASRIAANAPTKGYSGATRGSFVYEVLEYLPPGCSEMVLRTAEQKHIDRLRSWNAQFGFNMVTAFKGGDGPAQHAALQFRRALIERVHERARAWRYPYSTALRSNPA